VLDGDPQTQPMHCSPTVQALPSLHGVPSGLKALGQVSAEPVQ